MRKLILLFVLGTLLSCNSNKLEGVYFYEEVKTDDLFSMGKGIGCSMIGKFEFKDGKCYFSMMGAEQRADYEIDNGVIYLGSNALTNSGIGIKIIDENTIDYMGCTFKKDGVTKSKSGEENKE